MKKLTLLLFVLMSPLITHAQGGLTGNWKYIFSGGEMRMQINSNTIIINGESYTYKTDNNNLLVYDGNTYTAYPYTLNGDNLTLGFPDGSRINFTREAASSQGTDILSQSLRKSESVRPQGVESSALTGRWLFQSPQGELVLEFQSGNQLSLNGESTKFQLKEGVIQAMGDYGWIDYPYTLSQGRLVITFPDGTQIPFTQTASPTVNQQVAGNQPSGGNLAWQLQGMLCYWSGSSGSSSSYSSSERISFDGRGNFTFGRESSFSGNAGIAYGGNPNVQSGTYRVEERFVVLQFQSGESYQVQINMRQNNGRITELIYNGKLYATALCD
jgi:hypothetical protein